MKNNKGITLVALVITIIVLIILATVSIMALRGENGLISNSQKARDDSAVSQAVEVVNVALSSVKTDVTVKVAALNEDPEAENGYLATLTAAKLGLDSDYTVEFKDRVLTITSPAIKTGKTTVTVTGSVAFDEDQYGIISPATDPRTSSSSDAKGTN